MKMLDSGKGLSKILIFVGFIILLHAAFSAAQHRAYLRITEQDFTQLPLDIIIQTIIGLDILIYNIIQIVGDFKEIRAVVDLQEKSWDTLSNVPSFYIFNHRGKALAANWDPSVEEDPHCNFKDE